MTQRRFYKVGGHIFTLDFPDETLSEKELKSYAPFRTDSSFGDVILFTLSLIEDSESLKTKSNLSVNLRDENGRLTLFKENDGSLAIYLNSAAGNECCQIKISKYYRSAKAWIGGTPAERRYALDTTLMLLYTFASSKLDTLLVHASTVEYEGKGYLFLGKSGTGKSTHSRLWLDHIKGAELLNDDNPVVRIIDGKVYVFGSPWSGKTGCYRNRKVPVGGIVRLHQAPFNRIIPLTGIHAYAAILPSCSCMKWNHDMADSIHSTVSKVLERISVYNLECLPDQEAASMCNEELITNNFVGTHGSCVRKSDRNE